MLRSLIALAAVAGLGSTGMAIAQVTAEEAADAAEQVANEAAAAVSTFETIDPDTVSAAPAPFEPGLPPIVEDASDAVVPERMPAVRMVERSVVQTLPAPQPETKVPAASRELAEDDPFTINSILPISGTIRYGEWFWDESNAPKTGKLVITVDLDARVISAFRDGHEIGTAVALLGTQKHPTPLGTFPILTKEKDNVSEKYDNAPMPWTLRLTWDGIAIHGSQVINGYASHGCIAVPDNFAERLFAVAKRGDKVVITRGQMIGLGDKISG